MTRTGTADQDFVFAIFEALIESPCISPVTLTASPAYIASAGSL